jgi:hypothetical protein
VPSSSPGWYFLGTSISGQTFSDWTDDFAIAGPFPGASVPMGADRSTVFTYDGASTPTGSQVGEVNGWRIPTFANVLPGNGYRAFLNNSFFQGSKIIDNTGSIVQGTHNFNPTFNVAGYGNGGWNFLANPFPSEINWNAAGWTKTNIGGAIYIWNGQTQQYGAYSLANDPPGSNPGTNGVTNFISPGQAFFVRASGPSPVLVATEGVKSATNKSFIRSAFAHSSSFKISMTDVSSGYTDDNVIRFYDDASHSFDAEYDAQKMNGSRINLSSLSADGLRLCINTMPRIGEDPIVIPLEAASYYNGNFELRFENFGEENQFINMFLVDEYLNTSNLITEGFSYKFTINSDPKSQEGGRMKLVILKSDIFEPFVIPQSPKMVASVSDQQLVNIKFQNFNLSQIGSLKITDITGKEIYNSIVNPLLNPEFNVSKKFKPGVYNIQFENNGLPFVTKILIRE